MSEYHSTINGFKVLLTDLEGYIVKDSDQTPIYYSKDYTDMVKFCQRNVPCGDFNFWTSLLS